jgi:hypothetical protein
MLSDETGLSMRHLETYIHTFLAQEPPVCILPKLPVSETFLLVDGMWLKRWCVMLAYRRSKDLTMLHISLAGKESWYRVARDLTHIKNMHFKFSGIVSDGGRGIVSAIKEVFPNTTHQICMAHMHREAIRGLGKKPIDPRVRTLRKLADHMWLIESKEALKWWTVKRDAWIEQHADYLREYRQDTTGQWWYIHKGARKTVRILKKLPETSFKFLDKSLMPKTTNELEASFGHLGKRWLVHRGLRTYRWENFMKWFVYFYNMHQLTKRDRK